jgi:DNA-binding GntR family transcriptional regulator
VSVKNLIFTSRCVFLTSNTPGTLRIQYVFKYGIFSHNRLHLKEQTMDSLTLKEKAYIELRKLILTGAFKQGEFLTERILVEKLGMSRTPIRSAVERLEVEGLVKHSPNRGLVVAEISINKAVDIYDVRKALESHVVTKLTNYSLSSDEVDWFKNNLDNQKASLDNNDYTSFTEQDSQFHRKLAELHDNSEIISIMAQIQDKLFLIALNVLKKDSERIKSSYNDHVAIFEHIMQRNGDEAAKRMTEHLEYGKRILIS